MCAIVNGIIDNKDQSLLHYILEKVANKYDQVDDKSNLAVLLKTIWIFQELIWILSTI